MDGRDGTDPNSPSTRTLPGAGASFVSWVLLLMGLATFLPSVVVPEWLAYREFRLAEQREEHFVRGWETRIERERRLIEAIQTDPNVVARLAQRELGFRSPMGKPVRVAVLTGGESKAMPFTPEPVPLPAPVSQVRALLPALDYERLFGDDNTRRLLILMSTAVMAVAVWMPRRITPTR